MFRRDLDPQHEDILRQITRTPADDPLPQEIVDRYWSLKRCQDRVSLTMIPNELARICDECGYGKPTETEASPSIVELWKHKLVKRGDSVEVEWKNDLVLAVLKRIKADGEVVVQIEGEPEEITLSPDKVSVPVMAA